jgi:hypothetical protein
LTEK